jgi:transposase InsO family protein
MLHEHTELHCHDLQLTLKQHYDAYQRIGRFLEDVYRHKRVHSSLRYLTPAEFETQWLSATLDSRLPL